jgi:hypothetical protein
MGHLRTRDRRLNEVKAVLQRLQRISAEPDSLDLAFAAEDAARPAHAPRRHIAIAAIGIFAVLTLSLSGVYAFFAFTRGPIVRVPASAALKSTTTVVAIGAVGSLSGSPAPLTITELPASPNSQAVLQNALGHIANGRVQVARSDLLRIAPYGSVEVAWTLARSYDPNFLSTLPTADAPPNIAEATRWYRTWYAMAVKQGLVAGNVSLERIIHSMR